MKILNNLLELKGRFESKPNPKRPSNRNLPKNSKVELQDVIRLRDELEKIYNYWLSEKRIGGALISAHYKNIVAKSNRLSLLLNGNDSIVGARFNDELTKHIFTYFVTLSSLSESIEILKTCENIFSKLFDDDISYSDIEAIYNGNILLPPKKKTQFIKCILDCNYIESFDIDSNACDFKENSIVTIYKTAYSTKEVLKKFGVNIFDSNMLDENTVMLTKDNLQILKETAPFLISMQTHDLSELVITDIADESRGTTLLIDKPSNEPIIGVIDTMFDENVYFSQWVEFHKMISDDIEIVTKDYYHGTEVSSIIVDGPSFNPELDDHCGRFRVRHFGVATSSRFSSFTILKSIRTIISKNKDIKVWNLSLGSALEISPNFISPEAAELDKIQCENDCIFIVAGTNKTNSNKNIKIGAPADSLNSIVVNSVNLKGNPASYTRVGPVLSFFQKPDVAYYGGDSDRYIRVCSPLGENFVQGTSFAAPWISRKVAYLIHKLGFSREIAKALIIDSASKWNSVISKEKGYGVVPIDIKEIVETPNDEIKFVLKGNALEYETYNYNLPVPKVNNKHPFFAKATLCYFPRCSRNQGVDYTNTEVNLHFGRVHLNKDNKIELMSINTNKQDIDGEYIYEPDARKLFRKWDNIKHINEEINSKSKSRKAYEEGLWGIKINVKERLKSKMDGNIQFGMVITLKEMNGLNRIHDFIDNCRLKGWIVNKIEVNNLIDIYNVAEEEIKWD